MTEAAERGIVLVGLARGAIGESLGLSTLARPSEPWLERVAATFVTLRLEGELRGCIGTIDARRALGEDVVHNARAAAFRDPRFAPVDRVEFRRLEVEVSVLSPRVALAAATEAEAIERLQPGVDGLYLEYGESAATFLPQVWESLPDPLQFLGALRRKAGLPERFWDTRIRLTRYTVEKHVDERTHA